MTDEECQHDELEVEVLVENLYFVNVKNGQVDGEDFDQDETDISTPRLTCAACGEQWDRYGDEHPAKIKAAFLLAERAIEDKLKESQP